MSGSETVGVTDEYELTVEEILARHRAFEAAQNRSLDHYESRATMLQALESHLIGIATWSRPRGGF